MKTKIIAIALMSILLAACKTELEANVNVSDLNSEEKVKALSFLSIEVPSCNSYEDSRQESKSLIDIKEQILSALPMAEYKECYSKGFNSYAYFATPIIVGATKKGQEYDANYIYISGQPESGVLLYIIVPKELKKRINNAKAKSIAKKSIEFNVVVNLKNNTGSDFKYTPIAVYLDGVPIPTLRGYGLNLAKDETVKIKLSDTSVSAMLYEDYKLVPILVAPTK